MALNRGTGEPDRVKRDSIILSRGSIDALKSAIMLATKDYRDVLIGEERSWRISEIRKYEE